MGQQPDVCIVGGGPAGLAAAIALRLTGVSVLLLEANTPSIDKACGEGLMPDTLRGLQEMGVELGRHGGVPFRGVTFVRGRLRAEADFQGGKAIGIRRTVLHDVLVRRAEELGVDLRWGLKGVKVMGEGVRAGSLSWKPRLLVGCDGQNSRVRAAAGLDASTRYARRYGFRRHYMVKPWTPHVEVHWGKRCQVYVTPVSTGEVGVALLTSDPRHRLEDAIRSLPELEARLGCASVSSREMGATTVMRRLKRVSSATVALVGDASGSVDAITGEGIGLAVRQALALAKAFQAGRLEDYERDHRTIRRRPALMADLMLLLSRNERLQELVIGGFARYPKAFQKLLAFHVGGMGSSDASDRHADDIVDRDHFLDDKTLAVLDTDEITVEARHSGQPFVDLHVRGKQA